MHYFNICLCWYVWALCHQLSPSRCVRSSSGHHIKNASSPLRFDIILNSFPLETRSWTTHNLLPSYLFEPKNSLQRRVNEPKKRRQWKTRVSWLLLLFPTEHFHTIVFVSIFSHSSCFLWRQGAIWSHLEIIGSFMGHQADTYKNKGYVTLIKRTGVQETPRHRTLKQDLLYQDENL